MRKITSQNPAFLQYLEGIAVAREIRFTSATKAIEFYYNNTLNHAKGIDYEIAIKKRLTAAAAPPQGTDWLDIFATIGFYISRLGFVERVILAYFYGGIVRSNDKEISQALNQMMKVKNYEEDLVKEMRIKALRVLSRHFKRIGVVKA